MLPWPRHVGQTAWAGTMILAFPPRRACSGVSVISSVSSLTRPDFGCSKLEKLLEKYMPQFAIEKKETVQPSKEEDEMMAELAKFFVTDLGQRIQQFDLDVTSKNKDEVVRFGHSLKGTAGSYGFPKFSNIGSHIEKEGMEEHWEKITVLQKQLVDEYKLLG